MTVKAGDTILISPVGKSGIEVYTPQAGSLDVWHVYWFVAKEDMAEVEGKGGGGFEPDTLYRIGFIKECRNGTVFFQPQNAIIVDGKMMEWAAFIPNNSIEAAHMGIKDWATRSIIFRTKGFAFCEKVSMAAAATASSKVYEAYNNYLNRKGIPTWKLN